MRFSGIENRNFYGFGNETPDVPEKTLHMTETNEYSVFPALRFHPSRAFELHVGAEAKVIQTKGGDSLVEQEQVYGAGTFGEALVRAGLEYDSRGRSVGMTELRGMAAPDATAAAMAPPVTGVRVLAESFFVPKGWDATESFGGVEGSLSGYLGNQRLALATRVGGRALWGALPVVRVGEHLGRGPRRPRLLQRSLPRRPVALRQRRAALVDRQAQGRRAAGALGPNDLRRVRPRLVRGRRLRRSGTPATASA